MGNCKETAFSLWCDTTIAMVRESAEHEDDHQFRLNLILLETMLL